MKTEIETAAKHILKLIKDDVKSDDALRYTQAVCNLMNAQCAHKTAESMN